MQRSARGLRVQLLRSSRLATLLCAASCAHADGKLGVYDAWIRVAPPDRVMMAGYATLKNTGDAPIKVLTVQSDAFRQSSIHETVVERGVSRMRELPRIDLASGATVEMKPGGGHLMLSEPRHPIVVGEKVQMVFLLADGTRVETYFDVVAPETAGDGRAIARFQSATRALRSQLQVLLTERLMPLRDCSRRARAMCRARGRENARCATALLLAISSGVPVAMMRPPRSPPSGPRSMTQSAVLMTSRLCSMTTTVLPSSAQAMQHAEQLLDVVEVQARGRLVEDVERAPGVALGQLARQFHALRFAAGQRRRALAELDVREADVDQRFELARERGHGLEQLERILDRHVAARRRCCGPCTVISSVSRL